MISAGDRNHSARRSRLDPGDHAKTASGLSSTRAGAPRVDAAISVVETQEVHTASATSSLAANAFSANPATGDLIVCLVSTVKFSGEAPAHNACTDTAANAYTQIGTTLQFSLSWGAGLSLSMWRAENIIGGANFQVTAHAAADIDVMTVRA